MSTHSPLRPLSPHLQVYKPQITSILSIMHRLTGMGLTCGLFFFVYWLAAIASGPEKYAEAMAFFKGFMGQLILFLCLLGGYYHLANGIRHLAWDMGYGFSLKAVTVTGWIVIVSSLLLTLFTWIGVK